MTAVTWQAVLLGAADEIKKRHKARRAYMDATGRVCVLGACRLAAWGSIYGPSAAPSALEAEAYYDATGRLRRHLAAGDPWATRLLTSWSDRTPEAQVIATLREVARAGT